MVCTKGCCRGRRGCIPSCGCIDICSSAESEEVCSCPCFKTCIIKPEPAPLADLLPVDIKIVTSMFECCPDVVVVVGPQVPCELHAHFEFMRCVDAQFDSVVTLMTVPNFCVPVIYSPLVQVTAYHDVRVYHDAAMKAFSRVVMAEFLNPLLVIPSCPVFRHGDVVMVLGALQALYVPLQVREESPKERVTMIEKLWILVRDDCMGDCICFESTTIEMGRYTFRDLAMSDPERMTPIKFEDYIYEIFKDSPIQIEIFCETLFLKKEFPLFQRVNSGAHCSVPRYQGRIVLVEYVPPCMPKKTVLLVGKGVTFDTGGLTFNEELGGMSRHKSGAAVATGIMKVVQLLKPSAVHVIAALPLTRNVIGEEAYAADEIVKSRAGMKVRFNNTDAEGRLIMSDPVTFFKEQVMARNLPDAHIFTLGTMVKFGRVAVGDGYPIILDNSAAREEDHAYVLRDFGTAWGEPHEIYMLRKDDFDNIKGKVIGEDVIQSTCTTQDFVQRQFQIPASFLLQSTLMTEQEKSSCFPIKYTHVEMYGSAANHPFYPGSQPLIAIIKTQISDEVECPN